MQEDQSPQEEQSWEFHDEEKAVGGESQGMQNSSVSWSASEYVEHHKSPSWFAGFGAALGLLAIVIYLFTRDFISTGMVVIIGIAFGAFAGRPPRVLDYAVDNTGVHIGSRTYPYGTLKSFSLVEEDPMRSIMILPMQRFMPPISIYYDPEDEEQIINTLSNYLPVEDRSHDLVERLMRKMRF